MAAPLQPLPPFEAREASASAVARSIDKNRRQEERGSSDSPHDEPISPLHSNEDLDEPPTPKAGSSRPLPQMENVGLDNEEKKLGTNPWMKVLQSAVDHDDEHVTKVSLRYYL